MLVQIGKSVTSYRVNLLVLINYLLTIWQLVSTKKKQWITFKVSELEMQALEAYCQQTQRTKTDVLRDLIRGLPTYTNSRTYN